MASWIHRQGTAQTIATEIDAGTNYTMTASEKWTVEKDSVVSTSGQHQAWATSPQTDENAQGRQPWTAEALQTPINTVKVLLALHLQIVIPNRFDRFGNI